MGNTLLKTIGLGAMILGSLITYECSTRKPISVENASYSGYKYLGEGQIDLYFSKNGEKMNFIKRDMKFDQDLAYRLSEKGTNNYDIIGFRSKILGDFAKEIIPIYNRD